MRLHDVLDQRQTQPQTARPPRARGVGLLEALEGIRQEGRVDAFTVIVDFELCQPAQSLQPHLDMPVGRRELDRIDQEIPDHLLEPDRVTDGVIDLGIDRQRQVDAVRLGQRSRAVDRRLEQQRQIHRLQGQSQIAVDDPGGIEQVINQLNLGVEIALDDLDRTLKQFVVAGASAPQGVQPALDGVERSAQFVRDDCQHLFLGPIGPLRLGAGDALARQGFMHRQRRCHQQGELGQHRGF